MRQIPPRQGTILGRLLFRIIAIFLFAGLCAVLYALYGKTDDPHTRAQLEEWRSSFRSHATDMGRNLSGLNERLGVLYEELRGDDDGTTGALTLRVAEMRERLSALQERFGDLTSQEKWLEYRQALEDLYRVASVSLPGASGQSQSAAQSVLSDLRRLIQEASPMASAEGPDGAGVDGQAMDGPDPLDENGE